MLEKPAREVLKIPMAKNVQAFGSSAIAGGINETTQH